MFRIYDKNRNVIPFPDGVEPLDIFISSIGKDRVTDKLEGASGSINYGSTYDTRSIELELLLKSKDTQDYRLLRDAVYAMFQKTDTLYVAETYEPGKLYKIAVDDQFIPDRLPNNQRYADAQINCTMVNLPFASSIGTTQDIQLNGISTNDELWSFGMGLITDDASLVYTHTVNSFRIYNAGNVPIHPFEQELKITISSVTGSSSFLQLQNTTNGSTFRVTGAVASSQVVELNGANITMNGLQALRKTNRQFITLDVGWNDFKVTGALRSKIELDFRYHYL